MRRHVAIFSAVGVALLVALPVRAQTPDTLWLPDAVRSALTTHPLVARALAERDRVDAQADQVRSTRIPRITTDWNGMRHEEPMIVAPLHSFNPAAAPDFDRTLIQGNLAATWTLFDGGGRSARIARAETGEALAAEGVRDAQAQLIALTTQAYLGVLDARAAMRSSTAQVEAFEAERTRALRFEAEGRVAHVEVLRAEAALARARADLATARAQTARAEADLARLVGVPPERIATLPLATPALTAGATPERTMLLAAALEANPEVASAELRVAGAEAGRRDARSAFLPSVALAGRYNAYASGSTDLIAEWQGGLQVSWPVFTGGQRGARVAEADAAIAAARQDLRLAQLRTESAVDQALAALVEADARTAALDAAVTQFDAVVDVEQLALDAGAGVQTDFLDARASLLESETAAVRSRHAAIAARIALALATGQLTLDWIDANLRRSP